MKKSWYKLVLFAAFLLLIVLNFSGVMGILGWLWAIVYPLILGGCIAFVINILMQWLSVKVFTKKRIKKESLRTLLSLLCAILIIVLIVVVSLWIVIPQLIHSFTLLANSIPSMIRASREYIERLAASYPEFRTVSSALESRSEGFGNDLSNFLRERLPNTLLQTYAAASHTFGAAATLLIGVMFSLYLLTYKRKLGRQTRQLVYTYLPEKWANRVLYIFHLTSKNFDAFIFGQCLEALILFAMYVVVALIFRLPYSFMIATIIGIFSLIPLFGAWIGWVIGVILIITVNPWQALTFTIIFFVISQIEGNFIYPRIVGNTIGLPGIWVLAAITIGANMLGIIGMIIAVPIAALCYTLVSESSQRILREKPGVIGHILHSPDWSHFNPETDEFEDHKVKLENVLDKGEENETGV